MSDVGGQRLVEKPLTRYRTEEEYNRILALLDELIDEAGEDESHPLASMMEILGVLIEHYENAHVPELASE
jgi:HTH-type transcriptional regulator/antitoxin HigA